MLSDTKIYTVECGKLNTVVRPIKWELLITCESGTIIYGGSLLKYQNTCRLVTSSKCRLILIVSHQVNFHC